jgi:hypothetical protein
LARFTKNEIPITFDNDVAYAHYQVLFATIRDPGSANSMRISEIELLGTATPWGTTAAVREVCACQTGVQTPPCACL